MAKREKSKRLQVVITEEQDSLLTKTAYQLSNTERLVSKSEVVRLGMADTMQPGGTGWRVAVGAPYTMAGKTGTAQVISRRGTAAVDPRSLPMHLRHRALFVGFAPVEAPTIAVAIAVEGGGYGGSAAAPIARKIFDAWLLGKMPVPEGQEGIAPPDFGNVITGSRPAAAAGGALSAPPGIGPAVQMGGDGPPAAAPPGRSIADTPAPTDPDVPPPLRPDAGRRSP